MNAPPAPEIAPVKTRTDWKNFHALPAMLQRGQGRWVEPLRLQQRQLWAPRHPFFRHARARAWLARRQGQVVGRISAQIDELQAEQGRAGLGQFGSFELINDDGVAAALLDAASAWLRSQRMQEIQGPFDLSINQQCGLLVEGFDHAPMLMMSYGPRYYPQLLERNGFDSRIETLAYRGSTETELPSRVRRLLARMGDRLTVQPVLRGEITDHSEIFRRLFNASWAENWGFVPFTREEFAHMVADIRLLVRPGYALLARLDGEPAGFIVGLPDLNELIADLHGRLWPTGAVRLLWRIARCRNRRVRVPLMGVLPRHQGGAAGALISYALIDALRIAVRRDGVTEAEQSWILAHNRGMCSIIESLGMRVAQRFRIYGRAIAA